MADPGIISVVAAVIEQAQRYLICQRPWHKRHGGLWEFPGGKLEPTESHADAAIRELHEELGLRVTEVGERLHAIRDPGSPYVVSFYPVSIEGEPRCSEHLRCAWHSLHELTTVALAPSDGLFVAQFGSTRA